MKRYVKASLVDEFLKYHDDETNYYNNEEGFNKMYDILEKYDDSNGNDTVDVAFRKAPLEEQLEMIELIKPSPKLGQDGYAREFYQKAVNEDFGDDTNRDYCEGVRDAFEALFEERIIDQGAFR